MVAAKGVTIGAGRNQTGGETAVNEIEQQGRFNTLIALDGGNIKTDVLFPPWCKWPEWTWLPPPLPPMHSPHLRTRCTADTMLDSSVAAKRYL